MNLLGKNNFAAVIKRHIMPFNPCEKGLMAFTGEEDNQRLIELFTSRNFIQEFCMLHDYPFPKLIMRHTTKEERLLGYLLVDEKGAFGTTYHNICVMGDSDVDIVANPYAAFTLFVWGNAKVRLHLQMLSSVFVQKQHKDTIVDVVHKDSSAHVKFLKPVCDE